MSTHSVGLALLCDFAFQFLSSTENVKKVLEAECEEARYVLRPWPIETIITKEVDESCCTCESETSLDDHAEEIYEGIGRALVQAQELREKIAINVSKQKRKMRQPSLQNIYMPVSVAGSNKVPAKKDQSLKSQKVSTTTSGTAFNEETSQGVVSKNQSVRMKSNTASILDKKLLRTSVGNTMAQKNKAKPAKNFVAANKSNIKNCKQFSKSTVDSTSQVQKASHFLSPLSGTSQTLSGCSTSIAELNSLMDRVSVGAKNSESSTFCLQQKDRTCPFHGGNAQQFVQKKIRTKVDMIEGLDRYGVPGDVVRMLKMYHSYLNKGSADASDKKGQRAANRFLMEFSVMNEDRSSRRKGKQLASLTTDFASLFRDSYSMSTRSVAEADSIGLRYAELDSRSKECQLKKLDPVEFRKPKLSANSKNECLYGRGWSSNGVWNPTVIPDGFPGIMRALWIRYANKRQLLSFFEHNQRLQQLMYHRNLLELLLTKVVPDVIQNFDPGSKEYCEAYKTIFTVAQVLNPRLPVLVRTDI